MVPQVKESFQVIISIQEDFRHDKREQGNKLVKMVLELSNIVKKHTYTPKKETYRRASEKQAERRLDGHEVLVSLAIHVLDHVSFVQDHGVELDLA